MTKRDYSLIIESSLSFCK